MSAAAVNPATASRVIGLRVAARRKRLTVAVTVIRRRVQSWERVELEARELARYVSAIQKARSHSEPSSRVRTWLG